MIVHMAPIGFTMTILACYFFLGLIVSWLLASLKDCRLSGRDPSQLIIPGLVLAPFCLASLYQIAGINLLSDRLSQQSLLAILPRVALAAAIVFVGSGALRDISAQNRLARSDLRRLQFPRAMASFGLSDTFASSRFVFLRSVFPAYLNSYSIALGELIVIEAMLDIPGLGTELWKQAKLNDWSLLGIDLIIFLSILFGGNLLIHKAQRWCTERTADYEL